MLHLVKLLKIKCKQNANRMLPSVVSNQKGGQKVATKSTEPLLQAAS